MKKAKEAPQNDIFFGKNWNQVTAWSSGPRLCVQHSNTILPAQNRLQRLKFPPES
jgi:hypothetical protein